MSNNLLNNLFETNEEDSDDDNEDVDYNPDKEVVQRSDDSCSEAEDEDYDESDGHKRRHRKHKGRDVEEAKEPEVKEVLSEEAVKQKEDTIWQQFCSDLPKSEDKNNLNNVLSNESTTESAGVSGKQTITKVYDFAGQEVKVTEEVETNSISTVNTSDKSVVNSIAGNEVPVKAVKRAGGLGGLLDQLKKPKINTLQKSFMDWNNYKKEEGIEEELKQHNKSKDTYVERQAFLQRSDLRQFENEKQIREKNRSQRNLSKD